MAQIELQAECYQREPTRFVAQVTDFDASARRLRALGASALLVAGAVVSFPIPGWHLIGVPACLIGAVVVGRQRLREARRLEWMRGRCPACAERLELPGPSGGELPVTVACPRCREFLKLRDLR